MRVRLKKVLGESKTMRCRLDEIMKRERYTGRLLAEKVGVNEATISLIKREKHLPTLPVAIRIAKTIGVSVEDIWFDDEGT